MIERARKISASVVFMLGFTQLHSFLSAVYSYFEDENSFVWNQWVMGLFVILLFGSGFLLLKKNPIRVPALLVLFAFALFHGLSTYFYQFKLLENFGGDDFPFEYTGITLTVISILLFVFLLFIRGGTSASADLQAENWKTKWRISGIVTAFLAAGLAVWALILLILEYNHSSKNSVAFSFNTNFDMIILGLSAVLLLVAAILTFRKGSYLLAGLVLGIGFIYLMNYIWFDEWMRYAAKNGLKLAEGENRIFGIYLLMALFASLSGIFQLVGKKRT
ncbi:hypothetical protein [Listeria valentina]|uniref:hypothetical protein n=1 Tax=Listeria valentina TaxID=2705293 RepID=UPI001431997E|nr:hypothetical protein [Listeria valentina]